MVSEKKGREPSVSPTLWPTERAQSVRGTSPEQDVTLPDTQTHLQSAATVARAEPDPHLKFAQGTYCFVFFSFTVHLFDQLSPRIALVVNQFLFMLKAEELLCQ